MEKFKSSQRIGDIVANFPKSADIFMEYKIDFCCRGDRPLIDVIKEKELDEEKIMKDINKLYEDFMKTSSEEDKNWTEAPFDEIVDQIVNRYHAYLWEELPKISKLATTILKVHGDHHPELFKVYKLFNTLKMELEEHLVKEENIQYPAIRQYLKTKSIDDLEDALNIIDELDQEHKDAGDILWDLREVTNDYTIPEGVCPTFELTYKKLEELELDTFQHIHLENNILFPRLREVK